MARAELNGKLDIEVQVVPAHETEVEMSSETHRVRIRSHAPLQEIVEHADRLWSRACEDNTRSSTIGFGGQLADRSPQGIRPPGAMRVPPRDL